MNSLKHNHRLATSIACALLLTSPAAVQAAKTALVIGNWDYQWPQVSDLPNPKQDAEGMKQALTGLGFNVIYRINLTQADMEAAFQEFGKTLQEAKKNAPAEENVALFYYAGHAAEYLGTNYLLATNLTEKNAEANADSPATASPLEKGYEGIVPIPRLYGEINAVGETTNIFIVDGCRNNPLLSYNEVTGKGETSRSVGLQLEKLTQALTEVKKPVAQARGLADEGEVVAPIANIDDPSDSLFAYSTAKGKVAKDGEGMNSPYTKHLLELIRERGVLAMDLFGQVEGMVKAETKQEPWLYSSGKVREFYFIKLESRYAPRF
jgi:uncharacterized caspase-like protein